MKILFLESHPIWLYGLPNGFREAGHTVIISGPVSRENITEMIDEFKPDLIVSMGWTPEHSREKQFWIRNAIKKVNIPLVYWATEDPLHTQNFTIPLIKKMKPDFVFTVTPSLCKTYERMGIKAAHLDFSYHESVHHQIKPLKKYSCDIAVVANAYPDFLEEHPEVFRSSSLKTLIRPLIRNGIRIDFWGRNWEKMSKHIGREIPRNWIHGYLDYTEAYKVYSSAKIIIGLQNCESQLTQRTYEILGSGGVLLTSDTPAVRGKFEPGRDLIVSSSPQETFEKVKYYLKNDSERKKIRKNGKKAVKDDSYRHRAERMIEVLQSRGILRNLGETIHYVDVLKEKYEIHHVTPGETLSKIARKYNVSLQQIMEINHFKTDQIYAGQIIKIREKLSRNVKNKLF